MLGVVCVCTYEMRRKRDGVAPYGFVAPPYVLDLKCHGVKEEKESRAHSHVG